MEKNYEILKQVKVLVHEDLYKDLKREADKEESTVGILLSNFISKEAPLRLNI